MIRFNQALVFALVPDLQVWGSKRHGGLFFNNTRFVPIYPISDLSEPPMVVDHRLLFVITGCSWSQVVTRWGSLFRANRIVGIWIWAAAKIVVDYRWWGWGSHFCWANRNWNDSHVNHTWTTAVHVWVIVQSYSVIWPTKLISTMSHCPKFIYILNNLIYFVICCCSTFVVNEWIRKI